MFKNLFKKSDVPSETLAIMEEIPVVEEPGKISEEDKLVKQIHNEFDTAQDRILREAEEILTELKIPTESAIERKARLMRELGFVKNEVVVQARGLEVKREEIASKIQITKERAELLNHYKMAYPAEKFLTIDELDRICDKYGLIHAPIAHYVKDIPEKNLLEIKNCKKLLKEDVLGVINIMTSIEFWYGATEEYKKYVTDNILNRPIPYYDISESQFGKLCAEFKGVKGSEYYFRKCIIEEVDKRGYMIAAPTSHFDLTGLDKKGKHGYFNVTKIVVKDPVVFEFCAGDFVRVLSKWGTSDDQSYLDPALFDERNN